MDSGVDRNGLLPGRYSVRLDDRPAGSFLVEDNEVVDWVLKPARDVMGLCRDQPATALIFKIESVLTQMDEDGKPAPYLCDALDWVQAIQPPTAYSTLMRRRILSRLGQNQPDASDQPTDPGVGIPAIDNIRFLISQGHWTEARGAAQKVAQGQASDARARMLARLYLAVIQGETLSESTEEGDAAREAFVAVRNAVGEEHQADAFRVHNNFANYLAAKAQTRIYHSAVHAAANVESPLFTALGYWEQARSAYQKAAQFADAVSRQDQAALMLNQARLYATMGDFLRNLNRRDASLEKVIEQSESLASRFASQAVASDSVDDLVAASAWETMANVRYRRGDHAAARCLATRAMQRYQAAGSLAGLVSCNRTLGMLAVKARHSEAATNYLTIALEISELLGERVALGDAGRARAGYFAKHAYTNQRLIGLLMDANRPLEALRVAERSKARTFEDLLRQQAGHAADSADDGGLMPSVDEAIGMLGKTTVVIEYYVAGDGVYAFVIRNGHVGAWRLVDSDGNPLVASELIGRVAGFLTRMEGQSKKLIDQARRVGRFDSSWQQELHRFYLELIPEEVRSDLTASEHLVVIPHHILHYFPFAALVCKTDDRPLTDFQLPHPEFLIESGLDITAAPTLCTYAWMQDMPSGFQHANAVGISDFQGAPRLPGVVADLASFRTVFGERVRQLVTDQPVTESMILSAMQDDALLLLGTHGKNEADRPLDSFLLCDGDTTSNGRLTAGEIFQSRMGARAVMMSACYSGLADRSPLPGDDLFGLERALLQAGACSVVSGLWDVYDDTAPLLMRSTMQHIARGETVRGSLAMAQRDFLKARKGNGPMDLWVHPYFWAVYRCSGSGHTVMTSH